MHQKIFPNLIYNVTSASDLNACQIFFSFLPFFFSPTIADFGGNIIECKIDFRLSDIKTGHNENRNTFIKALGNKFFVFQADSNHKDIQRIYTKRRFFLQPGQSLYNAYPNPCTCKVSRTEIYSKNIYVFEGKSCFSQSAVK